MRTNFILAKVYRTSSGIIMGVLLLLCFFFHWPLESMLAVAAASLVIGAPAVLALHAICWLLKRAELSISFAWMLLLASLPLLAIVPALLLANDLPGNAWFLSALELFCGYASLLGNGNAIVKVFKSFL